MTDKETLQTAILTIVIIFLVIATGYLALEQMKTSMFLSLARGECINQTIMSNRYNEANNISTRYLC